MEMAGFRKGMKEYTTGIDDMGDKTDRAGGRISRLGSALGGAGKAALGFAVGGATVAAGAIAGYIGSATKAALETEGIRKNFDTLAISIGTTADVMLTDLRRATRGMVEDADLMQASNKFVSMGLANSAEEAANMAEMATQLGMAMGYDATQSMEDFALMMANQSLPRLDTFGISSGKVRERINELTDSVEGMTREQAFNIAVQEEAAKSMQRLGEQGDTTQANMARIRATMANLKQTIGQAFLPIFGELLGKFSEFVTRYSPQIEAAFKAIAGWVTDKLLPFFGKLVAWFRGDGTRSMQSFATKLMTVLGPAIEFARGLFESVVGWVQQNWPLIQQTVETVLNAIKALWDRFGPPIIAVVENVFTIIKTVIETAVNTVLGIIRAVMQIINGDWEGAWETIRGVVEGIWEAIRTIVSKAFENIKTMFGAAKDALLTLWDRIWDSIREKVVSIGTGIVNGIKEGISNAWETFVGWLLDKLGSVIGGIMDFFGIGSPAKATMPIGEALAQGIIVGWQQTLAALSVPDLGFNMPSLTPAATGSNVTNNSWGGDTIILNVSGPQGFSMAQKWVEGKRRDRLNTRM